MNDPHVAALKYKIEVYKPYKFHDPADVKIDTQEFGGELSKGMLTLEPRQHFATEVEVRPSADAFVLAWEVDAGLRHGCHWLHFCFEKSEIIDRQPTPGALEGRSHGRATVTGLLTATLSAYPNPPQCFVASPEVKKLWDRYCRFLAGKESLQSTAFWCLTLLQEQVGRKSAANKYRIGRTVMNNLARLSTERGDSLTARKVTRNQTPLAEKERDWMESAIRAIIRHIATQSAGGRLIMADLPPL